MLETGLAAVMAFSALPTYALCQWQSTDSTLKRGFHALKIGAQVWLSCLAGSQSIPRRMQYLQTCDIISLVQGQVEHSMQHL